MRVNAAGEAIGEKHHVELRLFGNLRDAHQEIEILAAGLGIRVAPAGDVMAGTLQEKAEMDLSFRIVAHGNVFRQMGVEAFTPRKSPGREAQPAA